MDQAEIGLKNNNLSLVVIPAPIFIGVNSGWYPVED